MSKYDILSWVIYMSYIYIILSQSGSIVSKAIKMATKKQFNHCSLSLDRELHHMYSMGRIFPNNPWIGGLVQERPNIGTYKKFDETYCRILKVPVTNQQYDHIALILKKMYAHRRHYRYNYRGLLLGKMGYVRESDHHFYCSEFVRFVLRESGVDVSFLTDIPVPEEFMNMPHSTVIYEGLLNRVEENQLV